MPRLWPIGTNFSFFFKNWRMPLDICAAHNNLAHGRIVLSMPSLGVSSLDFDRVGNDAVFFYPTPAMLYSAASGNPAK
jgi:hypothetical protein